MHNKDIIEKAIEGHPGYTVGSDGNIRSYRRGKKGEVVGYKDQRKGRVKTKIWKVELDGKRYNIHKLVAEYFVPNPENKPQIHHINGDRLDNRQENLMWVTQEEHWQLHEETHNNPEKPTLDLETGIIYKSTTEAARVTKMGISTISKHANGKVHNPRFSYIEYQE